MPTTEKTKIRVFITDDHPLMRNALEAAVGVVPDMEVVGEAEDGRIALALIPQLQPDVVIMDLMMPEMDGIETIQKLKESQPNVPVLALSSVTEEGKILEAVGAGARGYISKAAQREELLHAIRLVAQGETYLPSHLAMKLLNAAHQPEAPANHKKEREILLTAREREALTLLGRGLSNAQIAETMTITQATLRVHIHNMVNKLELENRRELLVYAIRQLEG